MSWRPALLLDGRTVEELIATLDGQVVAFEDYKTSPPDDPARFARAVEEYRAIVDALKRLYAYAQLTFDTDNASSKKAAHLSAVDAATTKVSNRIRFFTHWWRGLPQQTADALCATLGHDAYHFTHLRAVAPFILPLEQENIVALKDMTGAAALSLLHDKINSRLRYAVGAETLTDDGVRSKFADADPAVRRAAYDAFYAARTEDHALLAEIYKYTVLNWENERALRGYSSAIGMRNIGNDLPDAVVTAHLDACRDGARVWQRFFAIKEKMLGIPITRYDIYAPVPVQERTYTFEESVAMTLDALGDFSPRMRAAAQEIYAGEFVDALPRQGKRGGAYCWSVTPAMPPFLLYNFTGRLRDVSTVAHETGHGVHAQLARDKTVLSFGHALPIAETASVFSEMLLAQHLRATADPQTRIALLVQQLNDLYATVGRQSAFVRFEIEAHRILAAGGSRDDVNAAYAANLAEQFGAMRVPDVFKEEWLAIPHFFHTPFYCYAYSFGNLLTLGLYQRYREEGASFVPKYETFLAAGETMDPTALCRTVGVDITRKEFWERGFRMIDAMLDELEGML